MADYRHGILPSGAAAETLPKIAPLPFPVTVNHTTASLASAIGTAKPFVVDGLGDPRRVPDAIMAIAFAATWSFDITLTGPASLTHNWTGTLVRGVSKTVNDGGSSETGTALTTIHAAYSRPLVTGTLTYRNNRARWDESITSATPEHFLVLQIDPINAITYYQQFDQWVCASPFLVSAGVTDGSDSATVSSLSGTAISGLTLAGAGWELGEVDAVSWGGTIEPASWLS